MKFIVRTVEPRDISNLVKNIPGLIIVKDQIHDAMDTFYRSLEAAGDEAAVNMEDDIILCGNFYDKINDVIAAHPDDVIQFFSMRKDDLTIGTRYLPGRDYLMNQCFYLPAGMSKDLLEWSKTAVKKDGTLYSQGKDILVGAGCDTLMAYYFQAKKIKYLNWCPNLVDHQVCKSIIDPRRSSKRQSLTFQE
jgi:hypothetical protein